MEEQSDTPRTEMAEGQGLNPYFEGRFDGESDELCALRLTLARERDEARALNAQWAEKAAAWFASPEAAQRLQGYRDLAQQVAAAQNERDEARAKVAELVENGERLKAVADSAVRDAADMAEAKCAPLRDQIHQLQFDQQWAFDLVYRIRQALGDNGKLMQDELIEHCRKLVAEVEKLRSALQEIVEDSDDEGARECARKALAATEPKP